MKKITAILFFLLYLFSCFPCYATIEKFYPTNNNDDGSVRHYAPGGAWDTIHNASTGKLIDINQNASWSFKETTNPANFSIARSFFFFNTTAIPDDATINSVSFNFYVYQLQDATSTISYNIYYLNDVRPVDTAIYNKAGTTTPYSSTRALTTFTNSTWDKYILNSNGLSAINKTGFTGLAFLQYENDVLNIAPAGYASTTNSNIQINSRNNGLISAPYLLITYNETCPECEECQECETCPDIISTTTKSMFLETINYSATTTSLNASTTLTVADYYFPFLLFLLVIIAFSFTILVCWFVITLFKKR